MDNSINFYRILDFDTELFGYTVARLDSDLNSKYLREYLLELKDKNVRLVYWFVDPLDTEGNVAVQKNHGLLVDEKVTYVIDSTKTTISAEENRNVHSYKRGNVDRKLMSLALQSGIYSRFATDRHFVHDEYQKLYTIWLEKSVLHKIAFDVIVYVDTDNVIRGFITLESKGEYGSIGLIAVDKNSQGKSIGKALVTEALVKFHELGYRRVLVTTQKRNAIGCKFYEKIGFTLFKTVNVYHFWL